MEIKENVPLAPYTTFKIGGNADYFVEVSKTSDLSVALDYAKVRKLPFMILAGGSNMLISDEGYTGLVIKISFDKYIIRSNDTSVEVEAGCSLSSLIKSSCVMGLSGMESMYGIPGTVGGAVRGNAGAFGTEIKDVLTSATAINTGTREVRTFKNAACQFGYRASRFKTEPEWILLSVTFALKVDSAKESLTRAEETLQKRSDRQIQDIQSAGSFFMNPRVPPDVQNLFKEEKGVDARGGRVPAGWLIERAGFKDHCEKNVCTGARSANYFLNKGEATAAEVLALAATIKEAVLQQFGVELKEEITKIALE